MEERRGREGERDERKGEERGRKESDKTTDRRGVRGKME